MVRYWKHKNKKTVKIELLPQQTLCLDYERYAAWPNFEAIGSQHIGGLWRAHFLRHALTAEDLACAAWRSSIPVEILKILQGFADCHAELIQMAQAIPEIFVDWARWNPAFTLLAATYWIHRSAKSVPDIEAKKTYWENLDPRDILQYTRCDPSKSFLKALSKMPPDHCYEYVISRLREQWQVPEKRRLLRHLNRITSDTTWLLSCYPPFLDPGIHQLAASEPYFEEFHVGHIITDLSNRRELHGLDFWPYRNRIYTWEQLLSAYDRFLMRNNHVPERFPMPPVAGVECEELVILPITSRTGLDAEASEMQNCISSYLSQIYDGRCYAYRLLKPERATVLVDRRYGRWSIAEAMLAGNARQVKSSAWNLLIEWVMSAAN